MTDTAILLAVLGFAAAFAAWWRARDGRVAVGGGRLTPAQLQTLDAPASRALLLLFTAPACASCKAARAVLDEVAAACPGVCVRTVDVAGAPDLARAHNVLRAPTVFVIDPDGRLRRRISGVPAAADVRSALGEETDSAAA